MLDKDPIFFEDIQATVIYFHAGWVSACHTFLTLDPNHENK